MEAVHATDLLPIEMADHWSLADDDVDGMFYDPNLSSAFGLTWTLIAQPHAVHWRFYLRDDFHCRSIPLAAVMKRMGGFYQGERAVHNRRLSFASQDSAQQSLRS